MGSRFGPRIWDRVVIDVCTQRDFLSAGAILQVANRQEVIPKLKQFFEWVNKTGLPVVSLVESHRPSEPLKGFPLHCIDGTDGQRKLSFTLLHPHCLIEVDNYLSLPPNLDSDYRQLIFRKRGRDILSNPKADRLLTQLKPSEMILVGAGLERSIRALALALLARHKPVTVVSDACGYWSAADAELAVRQLAAKNIRVVTTEELTTAPPPPPRRRVRTGIRSRLAWSRSRQESPASSPASESDLPAN